MLIDPIKWPSVVHINESNRYMHNDINMYVQFKLVCVNYTGTDLYDESLFTVE